ncbi:MAG: hypothetical protein LBT05_07075 [Planctomycetaceae bacterium]|jgi:hypothetical protein|nr:hypothetical protein [Planctomycetaceae bacterium]
MTGLKYMDIFKRLFGKKESPDKRQKILNKNDIIITTDQEHFYKRGIDVSKDLSNKIDASTLQLCISQLYMHYLSGNLLEENLEDQHWENQTVFFSVTRKLFLKNHFRLFSKLMRKNLSSL